MKGAIAEDSNNTTMRARKTRKPRIGPSHHFLETFIKCHNSANNPSLRNPVPILIPSRAAG
jgi:hypothetical protein